jgi:hypothetical protein
MSSTMMRMKLGRDRSGAARAVRVPQIRKEKARQKDDGFIRT